MQTQGMSHKHIPNNTQGISHKHILQDRKEKLLKILTMNPFLQAPSCFIYTAVLVLLNHQMLFENVTLLYYFL